MDLLPTMLVNDRIHNWAGLPKTDPKVIDRENGITLTEYASRSVNAKMSISGLDLDGRMRPPWLIRLHEIEFDEGDAIGAGNFGAVYRGLWLGTRVVIREYGYEEDGGALSQKLFLHELRVWHPLNHPHVVKLFGASHRDNRFIVCEFAAHEDLLGFLKRDSNRSKAWQKLHEIALGLQYLHERNIIHNDLKCDNFLIGADGKAKISSSPLSSILNCAEVHIDPKSQGAVQWRSPEYLRGERMTPESDIYSFGMCILEAMTGERPWGDRIDAAVRFQVLKRGSLPLRPERLTHSQWSLIQLMCASDPLKRVAIAAVVDRLHDFAQEERRPSRSTN
ncbi:Serine/threonine-protein phosphatase 6 regulatory ankyrin repeat subunit [Globisporangium polare]